MAQPNSIPDLAPFYDILFIKRASFCHAKWSIPKLRLADTLTWIPDFGLRKAARCSFLSIPVVPHPAIHYRIHGTSHGSQCACPISSALASPQSPPPLLPCLTTTCCAMNSTTDPAQRSGSPAHISSVVMWVLVPLAGKHSRSMRRSPG